jgi:hypothetical protein
MMILPPRDTRAHAHPRTYSHLDRSFRNAELEITSALSALRRHGINVELPAELKKQIQATSLFDGDDDLFKEMLKKTRIYFEYGCGKSTEYVYRYTPASIDAVDTSMEWVARIKDVCATENHNRLTLNWIDVGAVSDWGYPTSFSMMHNFKKYAEIMWHSNKNPDLVLIDGRFRVSCFLTSIKFASNGTMIIFDDYIDRPFYHVSEEFCRKVDVCGRQALFEVTPQSKQKVTDEIILSFQNVCL